MKPKAAPVAQRPRPVPYYLQKPLKLWLDQCIEDVFLEMYHQMSQSHGVPQ